MSISIKEFETRYVKKNIQEVLKSWFVTHKDKAYSVTEIVETHETEYDPKDILRAIDVLLTQKVIICREGYYAVNVWQEQRRPNQKTLFEVKPAKVEVPSRGIYKNEKGIYKSRTAIEISTEKLLSHVKRTDEVKPLIEWVKDVLPDYRNPAAVTYNIALKLDEMMPIHGIRYECRKIGSKTFRTLWNAHTPNPNAMNQKNTSSTSLATLKDAQTPRAVSGYSRNDAYPRFVGLRIKELAGTQKTMSEMMTIVSQEWRTDKTGIIERYGLNKPVEKSKDAFRIRSDEVRTAFGNVHRPVTHVGQLAFYEFLRTNKHRFFDPVLKRPDLRKCHEAFNAVKKEYIANYLERARMDPSLLILKAKKVRYSPWHWYVAKRMPELTKDGKGKVHEQMKVVVAEYKQFKDKIFADYEVFKKEHPEIFAPKEQASVFNPATLSYSPSEQVTKRKRTFRPDNYRRGRIREYVAQGLSYEVANAKANYDLQVLAKKNKIQNPKEGRPVLTLPNVEVDQVNQVKVADAQSIKQQDSVQDVLYDCFAGLANKQGLETSLNNLAYFGSLTEQEYTGAYGSNHKWTLFVTRVLRYVDRIEKVLGVPSGSIKFNNGVFECDKAVTRVGTPVRVMDKEGEA